MASQDSSDQELLLDFALHRLDGSQRQDLERRLSRDSELATDAARLRSVLAPLDTWTVAPPPRNFVENILDRIDRAPALKLVPGSTIPPGERRRAGHRPMVTLRDVAAAAACILLLFSVFVPTASRSRQMAQRTQCGNHMASLFRGLSDYAEANAGYLPNVGVPQGANWLQYAPNRQNFRLLRIYISDPRVLVCPSRDDHSPMPADATVTVRSPIEWRRHVSYDMQNMAGPAGNLLIRLRLPIVSDANPLFEDGRFNPNLDPQRANSIGHQGRGQNVLLLSGQVQWRPSPILDGGDNIWTAEDVRTYKGTEVPSAATDAFLIP